MIPETSVNWKAFEYKFSDNPQRACDAKLYVNTLYYLEEYVGSFVVSHRNDFRTEVVLAQKTQAVLEYMVGQGSQIAFFIREEI